VFLEVHIDNQSEIVVVYIILAGKNISRDEQFSSFLFSVRDDEKKVL